MGKEYTDRYIAFLDILGFKGLVQQSSESDEIFKQIYSSLKYISKERKNNYDSELSLHDLGKEVSVFSDSIVISYRGDWEGAFFHVLMDLVFICNDLLNNGIMVRGGVTYGKLLHDDSICFGPAMVKAYYFESELAVYPRIIIDVDAIRAGLENHSLANSIEEEAKYLKNLIMHEKKKDIFYLDFLSQYTEFDDPDYYDEYIKSVRAFIINNLSIQTNKRILSKFKWFKRYYNRSIKKVYGKRPDLKI